MCMAGRLFYTHSFPWMFPLLCHTLGWFLLEYCNCNAFELNCNAFELNPMARAVGNISR